MVPDRLSQRTLFVLIIDDNPSDARLMKEYLSDVEGQRFSFIYAETLADGIAKAKENEPDVLLLDLTLPDAQGMKTFSRAQVELPLMPIIVLTGLDDETLALTAVHKGAQDYLVKGNVEGDLLARSIRYAVERKRIAIELKTRQEELEILYRVISSSNQIDTLKDLLDTILKSTLKYMDLHFGGIYLVEEEHRIATLNCQIGLSEEMVALLKVLHIDDSEHRGHFIDGKFSLIENYDETSPSFAKMIGARAVAKLPLKSKNTIIGSLFVGSRTRPVFRTSERHLLLSITQEIANAIAKMIAEEKLKEYAERIRLDLVKKKEGINKAQSIQQNLNTKVLPNIVDMNIQCVYMPSEELGGDFFDIRRMYDKLIVIIADCVGHGLEASMDAALLKLISDRHVKHLALGLTDRFLECVNKDVKNYFVQQNYPTMFVCVIDTISKELYYSNANFPLPYIVHNGRIALLEKPFGFHLGYDMDIQFDKKTTVLTEGQTLLFYSDSIKGIFTDNEEIVEIADIEEYIRRFGKGIEKDLLFFLDNISSLSSLPLEDDTTLIAIEHVLPMTLHREITAVAEIGDVLREVEERLTYLSYSGTHEIPMISMALEEACINGIVHGNKNDPGKHITVDMQATCTSVTVSVEDEGAGFLLHDIPLPTDLDQLVEHINNDSKEKYTHGRGIWLMKRYMTEVLYNQKGNRVTIVKEREPSNTLFRYYADERLRRDETDEERLSHVIDWTKNITLDEVINQAPEEFLFNLTHVENVTSKELGELMLIIKYCRERGERITFRLTDGKIKEMFDVFEISDIDCVSIDIVG